VIATIQQRQFSVGQCKGHDYDDLSHQTARTQFVEANNIRFAYRRGLAFLNRKLLRKDRDPQVSEEAATDFST
jgi:hypothetical protein